MWLLTAIGTALVFIISSALVAISFVLFPLTLLVGYIVLIPYFFYVGWLIYSRVFVILWFFSEKMPALKMVWAGVAVFWVVMAPFFAIYWWNLFTTIYDAMGTWIGAHYSG